MGKATKPSFPYIPKKHWWKLREKFSQSPSTPLTSSYIASNLGIKEENAKANIIPPMKAIGLVDENGKTTDLAMDWGLDSKYKEVCEKIITEIYPSGLRDLYSDANSSDVNKIQEWFKEYTGLGDSAAQQHTLFYLLLLKGDPNEANEVLKPKTKKTPEKENVATKDETKSQKSSVIEQATENQEDETPPAAKTTSPSVMPSLHIDIQIHISPEATPEQIDKIFESMARHLKEFNQ